MYRVKYIGQDGSVIWRTDSGSDSVERATIKAKAIAERNGWKLAMVMKEY